MTSVCVCVMNHSTCFSLRGNKIIVKKKQFRWRWRLFVYLPVCSIKLCCKYAMVLTPVWWLECDHRLRLMFECDRHLTLLFSFNRHLTPVSHSQFHLCSRSSTDPVVDSPQLSPFNSKGPLCLSPSFQMSTLSLPGQAPSPLQSPILSEVGSNARLEEEEEGRRKVQCLHATLPPPASQPLF